MRLFLAVQTQWRHAGMSGLPVGLDYVAVRAAMDMSDVAPAECPDAFARLRVIEVAALKALHSRFGRSGSRGRE